MGISESKIEQPATMSEQAALDAKVETTPAQKAVNDMSAVVMQQESYIQQLNSENASLKAERDAAVNRKNQYKSICKKHELL